MASPREPDPVVVLLAQFSRHAEALAWGRSQAEAAWGPAAAVSPAFDFRETDYYAATMGEGLSKQLVAFARLRDPAELPDWKRLTNAWEAEYAALGRHPEPRPLNLDPGYLTPAKFVLASTKDFAHRIYLRDGIYAEITLPWRRGAWCPGEFTFPDYRRADVQAFLTEVRDMVARRRGD